MPRAHPAPHRSLHPGLGLTDGSAPALVRRDRGAYLGLQRKVNPSGDEYVYFGCGNDVPVFDIGDLRPNLPALDAIVAVRKPGAKADRELVCDLTPADDADYYFHRVDNVPQQHVSWFGRVADCPLDLEPGTWEVVVYRRWRDRGPKTDRVEDMKLTIQAKR